MVFKNTELLLRLNYFGGFSMLLAYYFGYILDLNKMLQGNGQKISII